VNALLQVPLQVRLAGLFLLGLVLGGLVNWAIYTLAWFARPISPWAEPDPKAPPRRVWDRLPVVGWFGLRREASIHGRAFWVRPLLIELSMGAGLAALYWWETSGGLLPSPINGALVEPSTLHVQFLAHSVLFVLLMAATFIDFDEKTIPDTITIPGVLLGLLIVTVWPISLLPVPLRLPNFGLWGAGPLLLTSSPEAAHWPDALNGWPGLALGLAGYLGWCLAVTPATITSRRGLVKGVRYFFVSIGRSGTWKQLAVLASIGLIAIPLVWRFGGERWNGMLTSIAGIALGGGLVWSIRIVASIALRKEALGFGDVTLMAMIGAFLGWQASWLVFFLSPIAAVVVSLVNWLISGRRDLPFGPYLALAAAVVVVRWAWLWNKYADAIFSLGWLLLAILGACLMLLMGLLMLWRIIEEWLFGESAGK
jgi:leader peptidase (prepilin peptidase) / N-methyltransferase